MAAPEIWHGQEAIVEIGGSLDSIATGSRIDDQLTESTDYSGEITEITITDPEASADIVNTFDGQIKEGSPSDMVTVDFTMRLQDLDVFEEMHGSADTLSTTGGTWHRISGGHTMGCRPSSGILFKLKRECNGDTYILNYFMNDAWFTTLGEISLAADGTAELTGTAVCLIEDRYIEEDFPTS